MNRTPLSNRIHIGIFGRRNVGKSTLINAITRQEIAIVSELPGTTTDPVYKAMEIHDIGPVVIIDTGGIDDSGKIGDMRVKKAYKVLNKTDIVLLVVDRKEPLNGFENNFIKEVKRRGVPLLVVVNKIDEGEPEGDLLKELATKKLEYVCVSALRGYGITKLRNKIVALVPDDYERKSIIQDMLLPQDMVLMVTPLDIEAPKGRLKLPQVQTARDVLESGCFVLMTKESGLEELLNNLKIPPKLIITESHILGSISKIIPPEIPLTTFSILYARYKGDLDTLVQGAYQTENLRSGSKVLIAETCTHHPIEDDIGTIIIPHWLKTRAPGIIIEHVSGYDFPVNVNDYSLIIHCGGCMINRREMMSRIGIARQAGVSITNYGIFLAYMHGLLDRVVAPFYQTVGIQSLQCISY